MLRKINIYILFVTSFFLTPQLLANTIAPITIPDGQSIQEYIDSHPDVLHFNLEKGSYFGAIKIDRPLTLEGRKSNQTSNHSIIKSTGNGSTITITSSNVTLDAVVINGSGGRYDLKDAAIKVQGNHVQIINNVITNATFGIVVDQSKYAFVSGNQIIGNSDTPFGLRGDGIRLWETQHSVIISNQLLDSRDFVVWYASSNQFSYNKMQRGRYGIHFMYSHYNQLSHNIFVSNVVGSFLMYSRKVAITDNLFAGTSGPSGYGIGFKESGDLTLVSNLLVNNTIGIYSDNAPYDDRQQNVISHNLITLSEIAIEFHGSPRRNVIQQNTFQNNAIQVQVTGMASADQIVWNNNYFDDYRGYNLDGDQIGDISYEYRRLMNDLTSKYPKLTFFNGTVAYYLINLLGEALPLFKPKLIMKDDHPMMIPSMIPKITPSTIR